MLILTRNEGEEIHIGDDIVVKYLKLSHTRQIRLGIEAPKHISITRPDMKKGKFGWITKLLKED